MAEAKQLNQSIDKTHEGQGPIVFNPSEKHQQVVSNVFKKFQESSQRRDRNYEYFDGRNLIDYINDNVRRFITNVDERDELEDWQARVFDPFTRNKLVAILGRVVQVMPRAEFLAVGSEDSQRANILTDLHDHAERVDEVDELMFNAMLEAAVKGTVVGFEGYEEKRRKIRDIDSYGDGQDISIKEGTIVTRRLRGSIIPLEDFYPSDVGIRKICDMPYAFWRSRVPESQFKAQFNQYPLSEMVNVFSATETDGERPFYLDHISEDLTEGLVEVIRYYNQDTDEFVIIANGVWLNPMKGDKVMPIPFKHKHLPFWKVIYEPFGIDFFYGKSLPDKLKSMQDVLNVLHNMTLDQSFLTIFPPIMVSGQDDIDDDFIRPGRRIPVDDVNNFKELQMSTPGNWHSFMLNYTKKILEESSVSAASQGIAGTGERVTATEIEEAAKGASAVLGLFGNFLKWGIRDRAKLRAKNIMQFYTAPMIESILGEGSSEEAKGAFNTFKVEDSHMTSGKRGVKIIEMFREREQLPSRKRLKAEALVLEKTLGKAVEKIAITPGYIRNFEVDIRLTASPSSDMSKGLARALELQKARVYMEIAPDMVDREEIVAGIANAFGDDPSKVLRKDLLEKPAATPPAPGLEGVSGVSGGTGIAENLVQGITGGAQEERSVSQLLGQ